MKLDDVMAERVITVYAGSTVKEAVYLMNKYGIGCLVVQEKMKPVGIVTERDLLKRVLSKSRNPETVSVREVMSTPLVVGDREMSVEEAVELMLDKGIKKLPVIEENRLIGIVSLTDLIGAQPDLLSTVKRSIQMEDAPKRIKKVIEYYEDLPTRLLVADNILAKKFREP